MTEPQYRKDKFQKKLSWFLILVALSQILGICQASKIILTSASPDHTVTSGSEETIYGTSTSNRITIESGAKAELINFSGNNHIEIHSRSDLFTVSRSGAMVVFQGSEGTFFKLPVTTSTQYIYFTDRTLELSIYDHQVKLNDQVIISTPIAIEDVPDVNLPYLFWDEFSTDIINTSRWSVNDPENILDQSGGYLRVNTTKNLSLYSSATYEKASSFHRFVGADAFLFSVPVPNGYIIFTLTHPPIQG